jgi:hypothetical protein
MKASLDDKYMDENLEAVSFRSQIVAGKYN